MWPLKQGKEMWTCLGKKGILVLFTALCNFSCDSSGQTQTLHTTSVECLMQWAICKTIHGNPVHMWLWKNLYSLSCVCMVTQSCLTLCHTVDCSSPGSSVHGTFQVKILRQVAPGDLPNPGIQPVSPVFPALAGGLFTTAPPGKPKLQSPHLKTNTISPAPHCVGRRVKQGKRHKAPSMEPGDWGPMT